MNQKLWHISLVKKAGSVVAQLSTFHKEEVTKNCKYMSSLIEIILYIAKQGFAFRGHNETSNSINQGMYIFENNYYNIMY